MVVAGGLIVVVAVAGIAAWTMLGSEDAFVVETALVRADTDAPSATGSLLDATGYVVARRQATVSSRITGRVTEVLIEEGQTVRPGQILARLDDDELAARLGEARAAVETARARLETARVQAAVEGARDDRRQQLLSRGVVSLQSAEDARAAAATARANLRTAEAELTAAGAALVTARRALDDTVVRAPFGGIVTVKAAQPGEIVSPISAGGGFTRTGIGTVVDMSSLEVEVDVAEGVIGRVSAGMPAEVVLNAYPDFDFAARVIAVIPKADRSKATVAVRVGFLNPDRRIVPEMQARVSFLRGLEPPRTAARAPAILAPAAAIVHAEKGAGHVYVVQDGRAALRPVRLGRAEGDGVVIAAGLAPGERVVLNPKDSLTDGSKVRTEAE